MIWIEKRHAAPQPQPQPTAEASEIAAGLADRYGDRALTLARAALDLAQQIGVESQVRLWEADVSILKNDARLGSLTAQ